MSKSAGVFSFVTLIVKSTNSWTRRRLRVAPLSVERSKPSTLAIVSRHIWKGLPSLAEAEHIKTIYAEAHEGKTLPELLVPGIRQTLFSLSLAENAKDKARRGLMVLKSFLSSLKVTINDIEIGIDAAVGTADSGDIEADLPELLMSLAEATAAARTPVAI